MNKESPYAFLPEKLHAAHDLCFANHDILVHLLVDGKEQGVFFHRIPLASSDEQAELETTGDIFAWLEKFGKVEDRTKVIRAVAFPALLSDFLHFIFEVLNTSKKAKLTVSYALLRKPIQEILFVFEVMLIDLSDFCRKITENPQSLYSQSAGGVDVHTARIKKVLSILGADDLFDADYLAQLRYDKNSDDGFDSVCNKAVHLFTAHPAIKTETMNINFVFSGPDSKLTQWQFLYSRLPYVLVYSRLVVEKLGAEIRRTSPEYLEDIERRSQASVLLWAVDIEARYLSSSLEKFIIATRASLNRHCEANGYRSPNDVDLLLMSRTGSFPGETPNSIDRRLNGYEKMREANINEKGDKPTDT